MSDNPFADDIADVELPMIQDEPPKPKAKATSSSSSNKNLSPEELKKRFEELKERERQLAKRREEAVQQRPGDGPKLNWPSFFPILRYDPESDLAPAARKCVKTSLIGLCLFIVESIWNVVCVFSSTKLKNYPFPKCIVFSIIFGIVGFFLILNFGYNKLYIACFKRDIPVSFTICQFLIIAWCAYLTVGLPDSGSVGIAVFLDLIAKKCGFWPIFAGFINILLLAAMDVAQFFTLIHSQNYQKVSGAENPVDEQTTPETPLTTAV